MVVGVLAGNVVESVFGHWVGCKVVEQSAVFCRTCGEIGGMAEDWYSNIWEPPTTMHGDRRLSCLLIAVVMYGL